MGSGYRDSVTLLSYLLGTYSCDREMGGKGWYDMSCHRVVVVVVVVRYGWVDGWVLGVRLEGKGRDGEKEGRGWWVGVGL